MLQHLRRNLEFRDKKRKKRFSDKIREAVARRNKAYRKQNWLQFKLERNAIVKLIRVKIKEYYENMIDFNKDNPTSMWKTLKEIIREIIMNQ